MNRKIDELKSDGKYREAGAAAFAAGLSNSYGVHFGFGGLQRSFAAAEFAEGYAAACRDAR
jgi:hypothetical protein